MLFDVVASEEGRISQSIGVMDANAEYELVFHSAEYYRSMQLPDDGYQILKEIVVRVVIPDPDCAYHLPIMLSPHSYSVWWSGNPDVATVRTVS